MSAPLPRFRLYSKARDYGRVLWETIGGRTLSGDDCLQLEQRFANYAQSPHALCTAKARVAIYLALDALLEGRPKKVILSPYTISDVVNMVLCAGGIPVFADLEPTTCNISADEIERLIDDDTGAVLVTHLHGLACDIERISNLSRAKHIPLVEDAAQALGTRVNGKPVGSFGDAGVFSLGMYKNLNSYFGGMLVTPHDWLENKIKSRSRDFPPQELGYLARKVMSGLATDAATYPPLFAFMTFPTFRYAMLHDVGFLNRRVSVDVAPVSKTVLPETYLRQMRPLQARLALAKFDDIDDDIQSRIKRAEVYFEGLRDVADLELPPLRTDGSHTYTYFPVRAPDRNGLVRHLMRVGRDVAKQHLKSCSDLECFSAYFRDCPVSRATADEIVLLPTYPRYTISEVEKNVAEIRAFYNKAGP